MYGKIICQSRDIKDDFIQNFNVQPFKLHVINNPVEIIRFENGNKTKYPEIQFITVGRMRQEKGHVRILEALKYFEKRYGHQYQYHIVGDFSSKEMEKRIRSKVMDLALTDRVKFHGHLDEPMTILKESNVFLQGSYFEGFPNAVLESCSVGIPVVAYDVPGGTREIIKPGFNGYLIEDGNIQEYVSKMFEAANTTFNTGDMVQDILDRFNQEKIVKEYEDFFISITG
jgi:glycosyltransferase involved in cell wall biosynthesis